MAQSNNLNVTTSFRIPRYLRDAFENKVRRRGDRSKILVQLVTDYIAGKVTVVLPARKL